LKRKLKESAATVVELGERAEKLKQKYENGSEGQCKPLKDERENLK
jgi:predicted transcriptional regulator